ncbi:DNA polymerase-3 subunit gamma/tau [Methylorubrum rhodesianum]|uniref:DNA polymerase III subunit gamma/tau n=2 Tax=Methylorubrum rhodesianum TaxID=29427 RepID=A0ABU9ZAJ1_9HYPH|nr:MULTISPECIES: DNA polymerase III subunit gamma/tau [Methylorubrum]MBB5763014.1 DNA polymerase-3 subunit gamma/tau [Methylorubrum rhodesianum]MBI1689256.1 DNA polymerase III subunit gamma/tau [Methylorubrum sp. DB1722]MBK3403288.1 DNA polymerase III subunit gamma/tau [Methylorubrum rhodesianum]MBY0139646.1 DNA polymerase III subunit gamma/tau [Methylorubrum populi]
MDETHGTFPDEPGLPGMPAAASAPAATPYRVLARKYRPQTFDDLIGQGAMVRTLANAFSANRIPQAWMLTGVRGVGKTTTARILARGLNYLRTAGSDSGPTVSMPELGVHCQAIMESRHMDVLEMDAASHTGIDDVRGIIDGIRYAPVSARYKVYIVDEVHMLSEKAFNAFLKTLEEPPPHAKFVFATTEIRKVPVTILSRCQRFDLRRVEADVLSAHLKKICAAEGVEAEDEALAAVTRAAEGSVRDALSLLDQAIAHGAGAVTAAGVRDMLGLADRSRIVDLFEAAMRGDVPAAFAEIRAQYDAGADPAVVLSDLAGFTHLVTRLKLVPGAEADPTLSEAERVRGAQFAGRLPVRALSRAWQILLKALPEVQAAPRPLAAAEMAIVRLAYAADLPTPDEALRQLRADVAASDGGAPRPSLGRDGGGTASHGSAALQMMQPAPQPSPRPALAAVPVTSAATEAAPRPAPAAPAGPRLGRFEDVVAQAEAARDIALKVALERDVHLVRFEEGRIEFRLAPGGRQSLPTDLARALDAWTGRRWLVALSKEEGAPTLAENSRAAEQTRHQNAAAHPLVREVLSRFPGAQIVDVRDKAPEGDAAEAAADGAGPAAPPPEEADEDDDA